VLLSLIIQEQGSTSRPPSVHTGHRRVASRASFGWRGVAVALQSNHRTLQIASIQNRAGHTSLLPAACTACHHRIMERQTRFVLLVFAIGALLASSAAADLSAAAGSLHALPLRRVEDDDASSFVEEAAYPPRRALYGGGSISYGALTANKAVCYGSCAARGQAYTRGCLAIYGCRGGR
jgi:hypothetical protein